MEEYKFPENNWYIEIDNDNIEIVNNWKIKQPYDNDLYKFPKIKLVDFNGVGVEEGESIETTKRRCIQITTEQFKQYVLKTKVKCFKDYKYLEPLFKQLCIK